MDEPDIGKRSTRDEDDMEVKPLNSQILEFDIVVPSVDTAPTNISLEEEEARTDMVPKIGMEFESDDQAYEFYSSYAKLTGFIIRNDPSDKSEVNGEVLASRFPCSKESFVQNEKYGVNARKCKMERKTSCLAQMIIARQSNGKYAVIHFEAKHNHELRTPHVASSERPEGRLLDAQSAGVDSEDRFGRHSESAVDNNNLLSKRRREMEKEEEKLLLDCLQKLQLEDPSLFYGVQRDTNDDITNIFWADNQMIVDYGRFGDVVCFDTTCRTNKDFQPLVPFIGINHHKQVVIFGATILYDDTIGSFEALFQTFMIAMSGQKPKTMLTDQRAALREAINLVMPETNHRICIWNIYQDALSHLSHAFNGSGSFSRDFSSCIYDHEEKEDFIQAWEVMLDTHNLRKNEWLKGIFDEREKWAIAYRRHTFYADLKNSELINSFNRNLMDHLNLEQDILQFFEHFESVVSDLRCKELEASYDIFEQLPTLLGNVILLKHARDVYTPEVFKVFQQEYEKCLNLVVNDCGSSGSLVEYRVNIYEHPREYKVTFNSPNNTVVCSCMKFEFDGVLCRHALKVLDQRNIKVVPTKYMLNRWTKDARAGIVRDGHGSIIEDPMLAAADNFKILCHKAAKVAAVAAESGEAYQHVNICFDEMMRGLEKISKMKPYMDVQVAETSEQFDGDGDGDAYFRDEPAFPGGSSTCASDFISTGYTTPPDYLMLHKDVMVATTYERSSELDAMSLHPVKMCTACKTTVSSTWRYGPKGPRTLCNACGLRYKKEHIKLQETPADFLNPKGSAKRRKSSTANVV